ncbi:3'(2'),5'-bisphosphate nucleotidase CysQ [Aquibaculum arenosum]|uniref:3'(2'),5'-bisphosphate nucleotidase CysQ n=1 Tax=Aquibaculum arenosum TaxID=3032591 RepID=A0ABT5YPB5_9PROT|nr:3'(2'),5'-bisphosphate nucleotidase CysQ [Fodinicurvata sp. CAU 1616]MDF2096727.1 3'(2'),5'-bisphosphate nucleotidase CysQ [Fodinicurvata sp. CAU 1616]
MVTDPTFSPLPDEASAEDLLAVLRSLAEQAGKVVLEYYAQGDAVEVRDKDDASPVTAADEACERFILQALKQITPSIPIISEEAASAGELPDVVKGGRFWLVDPLDGTKEFLSRNGEFTVNIALVDAGRPIAGVVHAPALDATWIGARINGQSQAAYSEGDGPGVAIRVRACPNDGATIVASRRHGSGGDLDQFLARFTVKDRVSAGSSLKFCLIASAKADIYPRFGRTMEWDTAAGQAVLEAAGGRVETVDEQPLTYGKPGFENPHFIAYGSP